MPLLDFLPRTKNRGASGTWRNGASGSWYPAAWDARADAQAVESNPMVDPIDWLAGGLAAMPKAGARAVLASLPVDAAGSIVADRVAPWVENVPVLGAIAPIAASIATGLGVRRTIDDLRKMGVKNAVKTGVRKLATDKTGSLTIKQPKKKYYRYSRGEATPDNGIGFTMWADEPDQLVGVYGDYAWEFDGSDLPHVDDIADVLRKEYLADLENYRVSSELEDIGDGVLDDINPEHIVDSAGSWDVPDFVEWFSDRIAVPRDIKGIRTNDGAILFDQSIAKRR